MGKAIVRKHVDFAKKMENLSDGIKKNSALTGFPPTLTETAVTEMLGQIETVRNNYEASVNSSKVYYEEYKTLLTDFSQKYSNFVMMVYGYFGKRNQQVADFGLAPYKKRTRQKVQAANTPKPA